MSGTSAHLVDTLTVYVADRPTASLADWFADSLGDNLLTQMLMTPFGDIISFCLLSSSS